MTEPRVAQRDGARFVIGTSWLGAAAASVCFCINASFVEDRGALWLRNELHPVQRRFFVLTMIASAALPALLAAVTIPRRSLEAVASDVWLWGHRLAPLVLLAPIAPLIDRDDFIGRPITTLSYILIVGLLAAAVGTRCLEQGFASRPGISAPQPAPSTRSLLPACLTGLICLSLFAHFAFYAVLRHHQLRTDAYDLGIFDNMMWNLTHGEWFRSTPAFGPEGNHLHRHTTFGALLFVPFYAIWPRAETLLVLQAAFAASTPIPIYLLGRRLLDGPWLGFLFALCYALYAPTHGAVFYDFHFLTLAAPLFAWVFYLSFTDRTRALAVMTILTLAWREDTGAVLAFAGMVLLVWGVHPKRTLIFVFVCGAHFVLTKFVFMPLGGSHASFADYYLDLQGPGTYGFWAVVETTLTNPYFVFDEVFGPKRLLYVLHIFVPLLFFPLRAKATWIAFVPAAVFTLMSSRNPLHEIYFQYTVLWAPTAFLLLLMVLRRRYAERGRHQALIANTGAIVLSTLLSSYFYGSVFESPRMRGGFRPVSYEWTEADESQLSELRRLAAMIPPQASVAATSREVPHLSNRRDAYSLLIGYFDADYLVVRKSHVEEDARARKAYDAAIATGRYEAIAEEPSFLLWKRDETY